MTLSWEDLYIGLGSENKTVMARARQTVLGDISRQKLRKHPMVTDSADLFSHSAFQERCRPLNKVQ